MQTIKLGTRGSKLALWQAYFVKETLEAGGLPVEIVIIETKGDQILDRSLSKIGSKGVFTEELEEKLLSGEIHIAQHSAKDLQSDLGENFEIIAFSEREKVNDVLISFDKSLTLESGQPFVVGTSSTRRVAMLKHFYPHIKTVDMRGNLQTRMGKLESGVCDALLLAFAGVHRMGYEEHIAQLITTDTFTPAVGQGSVAIECAVNLDADIKGKIRSLLNHPHTEKQLLAERAFLKRLQGGCSIPVFGLAQYDAETDTISMTGGIISLDGKEIIKEVLSGSNPEEVGFALADKILDLGGGRILQEIKANL
ncbi:MULTISPECIES: hydroxymethylbilane synthase [Flectobacillus]|jgi:hydroxymethylbilane synthase|uniref:Porphobilinogen deaminase n=2 Tax=Flectobacillus TaxID=101 RepID=A0ABT6Z706_9BACT|nr:MULTISPECIES: hydroxymethylbilane synthase [Flectobacillus]MDI9865258.1 hydroxymethylbilane synthase [Flectobacillus longus]MDI9876371.1 hydroxymethylbilane synthase [Flectobacillus rivi]MDI9878192.1 hydroxymethylbilane synthase [Flectobacillus longus]